MKESVLYIFSAYSYILSLSEDKIPYVGNQEAGGCPIPSFDEDLLIKMCEAAKSIFETEPNILEIDGDTIIVGDIHGSFHDLLRILNYSKKRNCKVLFLGDYVDRGSFSLECVTLLFSFKIRYPTKYYLIRGNHEFDSMCSHYGFEKEILNYHDPKRILNLVTAELDSDNLPEKSDDNSPSEYDHEEDQHETCFSNHSMNCHKYTEKLYNSFMSAFSYLPICAIVNKDSFCVHGGLSPQLDKISKIESKIQRPINKFEENSFLCDLLWADPSNEISISSNQFFSENPRGKGNFFSGMAVSTFLKSNNLKRIIRAHECVENGTEESFKKKCITVFSASSYNHDMGNSAGILKLQKNDGKLIPVTFEPLRRLRKEETFYYKVQPYKKETTRPTFNVYNPVDRFRLHLPNIQLDSSSPVQKSQRAYFEKKRTANIRSSVSFRTPISSIFNCKKLTYNFSYTTCYHSNFKGKYGGSCSPPSTSVIGDVIDNKLKNVRFGLSNESDGA